MRFWKRDSKPAYAPPPAVPPQYRKERVFDPPQSHSQQSQAQEPASGDAAAGRPPTVSDRNGGASRPEGRSLRRFSWPIPAHWMFVLGAVTIVVAVKLWDEHTFHAMTSVQHLDSARSALADKRFDDGLYQLSAIKPGAPQSADAKELQEELTTAKDAARQERAGAPQSTQISKL